MPIAIGANIAAAAAGIMALRRRRKPEASSMFAESKSTLLGTVTKAAFLAASRALLRQALVLTSEASSAV
ncbi:MAG TPA: hypothetical protein VHW01_14465 [Polyangiaceae bacterium]|jgi:hypothetical protein|nr:hypothetical protein [Polyangiaceae bacterium]